MKLNTVFPHNTTNNIAQLWSFPSQLLECSWTIQYWRRLKTAVSISMWDTWAGSLTQQVVRRNRNRDRM